MQDIKGGGKNSTGNKYCNLLADLVLSDCYI